MADTARASSRGLILLTAALRRFAIAFGQRRFDITLPARPSSLLPVRRALRRLARAAGFDDDRTFALQVAVGEAITNVIEHAYGGTSGVLRVCARRDGEGVVVEVTDYGRWRSDHPGGAQRGRGIRLMRGLANAVDIRTAPEGTTVRLAVAALGGAGHGPSGDHLRGKGSLSRPP